MCIQPLLLDVHVSAGVMSTDSGSLVCFQAASTDRETIGVGSTTMSIETAAHSNARPPVDERVYSLTSKEAMFFKSQTGIGDEETLKQWQILAV